jgi:D-alanine-D-alanine ligase
MKKKINLAVIFGGESREHEVSVSSVRGVMGNLDKKKYNIIPVAITKKGNWLVGDKAQKYLKNSWELINEKGKLSVKESQRLVLKKDNLGKFIKDYVEKNKIDLVLPILHGTFGEDGTIQGVFDFLKIPYVFSGVLAQALAMDKFKTKKIAKESGILTAESVLIKKNKYKIKEIINQLKFPIVVKPNDIGSSVAIMITKDEKELVSGIKKAFEVSNEVLIEKYIPGREFSVSVMEVDERVKTLAIIEIIPLISEFYDYKAKYQKGGSEHVCPAKIVKSLERKIEQQAGNIFEEIGCNDVARVDFIYDDKNKKLYFLEINTIPGMTPTSLVPEAARQAGMSYSDFLDRIIKNALRRKK